MHKSWNVSYSFNDNNSKVLEIAHKSESKFIVKPSLVHRLDKNNKKLINDNRDLENMFNRMKLNMSNDN